MSQGISLAAFENSSAQVVNRSSTPLMIEENENEQLLIVCDRLATVLWTDWRRQARRSCCSAFQPPESHPKTAATVVAWQSFPFFFPAVIVGLSQPRRLLGPVFDDDRGHIHVGLDSGSAVLETKCVRQFPSIIPGLLFCR